jgi:hypothetical protein
MRPCSCNRVILGQPFVRNRDCGRCWHWFNSTAFRVALGGPTEAPTVVSAPAPALPAFKLRSLPCIYEGAIIEACTSCGKKETRHVRDCDIHEKCTRGFVSEKVQSCDRCSSYQPEEQQKFTTRHLLYHLYPLEGPNGAWKWNVEQLCRRMELFNGKRVVAVALDPPGGRWSTPKGKGAPVGRTETNYPSASLERVKEEFGQYADSIDWVVVENDPELCELTSFDLLYGRLRNHRDPSEAIFYGHSRGTTRPSNNTQRWTEVLYETYLDYWALVEEKLAQFPVVGSFKKTGRGWPEFQSDSQWHYSGSFLWIRPKELFEKEWRKIDRFWSGIEPWPSLHFKTEEAGVVFHERTNPQMNLYDHSYWKSTVDPELKRWKQEHKEQHQPFPPTKLAQLYSAAATTESDINEHIPLIREYASKVKSVVEFGVRTAVSTVGLVAGVYGKGRVVSYDLEPSTEASALAELVPECFEFRIGDSREVDISGCDLLFLDTVHTAEHLQQELELHALKTSSYILIHDTHLYGTVGSDGKPGLETAIQQFLEQNPQWAIEMKLENNNGMTVLVRSK